MKEQTTQKKNCNSVLYWALFAVTNAMWKVLLAIVCLLFSLTLSLILHCKCYHVNLLCTFQYISALSFSQSQIISFLSISSNPNCEWSFKERRHVANKLYCFRKAKPAKCYWNPNKCERNRDAFKCTHTKVAAKRHRVISLIWYWCFVWLEIGFSHFLSLSLSLLAFVFSITRRVCLYFCVSFVCLFVYSFWAWAAVLNAIRFQYLKEKKIVKQHPNCCNTYIMPQLSQNQALGSKEAIPKETNISQRVKPNRLSWMSLDKRNITQN